MRRVLVLGGTGWLGMEIIRSLLRRGDQVTALARGSINEVPDGAELIRADRRSASAYESVSRDWDEIIEISWDPELVTGGLSALADHAAHWTLISSISVYASNLVAGADESDAVVEPEDLTQYPDAKVAVERATTAALGDRLAIIRPGLIVGPGDPSDRFGYWVGRFELAGAGDVLAMPTAGAFSQVIDVRDLSDFVADYRGNQVLNAIGAMRPLAEFLQRSAAATGFTGELIEAPADWLQGHGVEYWAGPKSLPLWLPTEDAAMTAKSNSAWVEAGGSERDLDETIADILRDEMARGLDRPRRAGLRRDDELALLAELGGR